MSRLEDQEILDAILEAFENAAKNVQGYVSWKRNAWEWVAENLDGETQTSMAGHLLSYVRAGGKIDQVVERRGFDDQYHYDFRIRIATLDVYIETVVRISRTGPAISVMSTHLK